MKDIKLKGTPKQGLTGTTLGFFFGFAAVSLYGPTATHFKEAMSLSPALLGLLVAIPSLSGSLLRIPFGAWVDTTSGQKTFFHFNASICYWSRRALHYCSTLLILTEWRVCTDWFCFLVFSAVVVSPPLVLG
ncbi:MAG: hypothetical protein U5L09_20730 [Bacteroidales bacterium]|nr:hypothetical protein [Bacteroidales bacterium]